MSEADEPAPEDEDEDGAGTGLGNGVCKCLRPRLITGTSTKDGEFPATVTSRRSVRRLCLLYRLTLLLCLAGIQSVCAAHTLFCFFLILVVSFLLFNELSFLNFDFIVDVYS